MQQIVITKSKRRLELFEDGRLVKGYRVVLGSCPVGDKTAEGDGKTPEGEYRIFVKNDKSKYFLSLGISYPARKDAEKAMENGAISDEEFALINEACAELGRPPQKTALGGEIYIHGGGTEGDWTEGCIALDNADMQELFDRISVSAVVKIVP